MKWNLWLNVISICMHLRIHLLRRRYAATTAEHIPVECALHRKREKYTSDVVRYHCAILVLTKYIFKKYRFAIHSLVHTGNWNIVSFFFVFSLMLMSHVYNLPFKKLLSIWSILVEIFDNFQRTSLVPKIRSNIWMSRRQMKQKNIIQLKYFSFSVHFFFTPHSHTLIWFYFWFSCHSYAVALATVFFEIFFYFLIVLLSVAVGAIEKHYDNLTLCMVWSPW